MLMNMLFFVAPCVGRPTKTTNNCEIVGVRAFVIFRAPSVCRQHEQLIAVKCKGFVHSLFFVAHFVGQPQKTTNSPEIARVRVFVVCYAACRQRKQQRIIVK